MAFTAKTTGEVADSDRVVVSVAAGTFVFGKAYVNKGKDDPNPSDADVDGVEIVSDSFTTSDAGVAAQLAEVPGIEVTGGPDPEPDPEPKPQPARGPAGPSTTAGKTDPPTPPDSVTGGDKK